MTTPYIANLICFGPSLSLPDLYSNYQINMRHTIDNYINLLITTCIIMHDSFPVKCRISLFWMSVALLLNVEEG